MKRIDKERENKIMEVCFHNTLTGKEEEGGRERIKCGKAVFSMQSLNGVFKYLIFYACLHLSFNDGFYIWHIIAAWELSCFLCSDDVQLLSFLISRVSLQPQVSQIFHHYLLLTVDLEKKNLIYDLVGTVQ